MSKSSKYLKILIKNYPSITSGRKNFVQNNLRIKKSLALIKKYFKKPNN